MRSDQREALEDRFTRMEERIRGQGRKWARMSPERRKAFAAELSLLVSAGACLAWAEWNTGTDYLPRIGEAVVRAAKACSPGAQLTVIVDGLKEAERPSIARRLRLGEVSFRSVKVGGRDESYPLLRLADAVAGYLNDVRGCASYAVEMWPVVQQALVRV